MHQDEIENTFITKKSPAMQTMLEFKSQYKIICAGRIRIWSIKVDSSEIAYIYFACYDHDCAFELL